MKDKNQVQLEYNTMSHHHTYYVTSSKDKNQVQLEYNQRQSIKDKESKTKKKTGGRGATSVKNSTAVTQQIQRQNGRQRERQRKRQNEDKMKIM